MKRQSKVKILVSFFLFFVIFSSFSQYLPSVLGESNHSDDNDLDAKLDCKLETDSSEIATPLMSLGTYSFPQQPSLDVGSFSHDLTSIDVSELQYADELSSDKKSDDLSIPANCKENITTNAIEEYITSAPKDTSVSVGIDYDLDKPKRYVVLKPTYELTTGEYQYGSWYVTSLPAGECIDDDYEYPDDGDYLWCQSGDYQEQFISFMSENDTTFKLGEYEEITELELRIRLSFQGSGETMQWDVEWDNTYDSIWYGDVAYSPFSYTWITYTKSNLHITQVDHPIFRISVFKDYVGDPNVYFSAVQVQLTIQNRSLASEPFKAVQVNNLKYQVLGTNYTDTFNMSYNSDASNYAVYKETNVYAEFYFTSAILENYDYINDLKIYSQNLTLTFFFWYQDFIDYEIIVNWSQNQWKVPSEIDLKVNSESVIDESYNSGYLYLSEYPTSLIITSSSSNIYFKLNITVYFRFNFELDIISKTYLRKTFELESNHEIEIDRLTFNSNLNLKKIYLNNIDKGSSNPCLLSPSVSMDTNNIFNLEVLLDTEIYRELPYDDSRELYSENWSSWNLDYDSEDTISSYDDNGNLSSQLQEGHYPATYSFKNDEIGSFPDGWSGDEDVFKVEDEFDGHKSVFVGTSTGTTEHCYQYYNSPQTEGVVEFWFGTPDSSKYSYVIVGNVIRIHFNSLNSLMFTYNGYNTQTTKSVVNNKMYHIRVEFDLSIHKLSVWLEGNLIIDNKNTSSLTSSTSNNLDFIVHQNSGSIGVLDAVGYSWDEDYVIGDNLHYENYMGTHDFENYNQSTYANYFGTYDFEDYQETESNYGNYAGTHSFEGIETEVGYYKGSGGLNYETIGAIISIGDNEWIDSLTVEGSSYIGIDDEYYGHKNVLNLTYVDGNVIPSHTISESTSGTIEFWMASPDTWNPSDYLFEDGGTRLCSIRFYTDYIQYKDSSGVWQNIMSAMDNNWYHIKYVWYSDNTHDIYVNGTKHVDGVGMENGNTQNGGIDQFRLRKLNVGTMYIDAPAFIGETDFRGYTYAVGWNNIGHDIDELLDEGYTLYNNGYNSDVYITDVGGHNDVLTFERNTSSKGNANVIFNWNALGYGDQEYGAVEFWIRGSDTTYYIQCMIQLSDYNFAGGVVFGSDAIYYRKDDSTWGVLQACSDNTWYHIRITWDCTSGGYDGLTQYYYKVYVNSTEYGEYHMDNEGSYMRTLNIYAGTSQNYLYYLDPIDFSCDPDYTTYRSTNPYGQLTELEDDGFLIGYTPYTSYSINTIGSPHNKIINCTDSASISINAQFYQFFASQTSGTIEFWIMSTDITKSTRVQMSSKVYLIIQNDFQYYDGSYHTIPNSPTPVNSMWYHIRILFDGTTDKARYFINGVDSGEVDCVPFDTLNVLSCYSAGASPSFSFCISIFDFSWDSNYVDERSTNPYYEDLRDTEFLDSFTIDYSYDCYTMVNGTYDAYKKHIQIYDNNVNTYVYCQEIITAQSSGIIEFWMRTSDASYFHQVNFDYGFHVCIDDDEFKYYNGGWISLGIEALDNEWYHLKVNFDCSTDTFDFYVNNTLIGDDLAFQNSKTTIGFVRFNTGESDSNYYYYIDALSYSWEDDIGVNLLKEIPEIEDPYCTINKTISYEDPQLYSYDITLSFNYKFTQYGSYYNNTLFNGIDLIDDNCIHTYTETFTNQNEFFLEFNISNGFLLLSNLKFTIENQYHIQKTKNPTTEDETVEFIELFECDRTFSYWYFKNNYTIDSLILYHQGDSYTIPAVQLEEDKYYFEYSCQINDEFTAYIKYIPHWVITYEIQINNGTYTKIKINYKADFQISNVSLILNLEDDGCYNENWTLNATENVYNYKLTIPNLEFENSYKTLYVEGYSSIPYAKIEDYESDQGWNRITEDNEITYAGFIEYTKFTNIFLLPVESSWNCYNVYYGREIYSVEEVEGDFVKVQGDGFDPHIDDSYLHFTTNPFSKVDWNYHKEIITITIVSELDVEYCYFKYRFDPSGVHTLEVIDSDVKLNDLTDSGDYDGWLYFNVDMIKEGKTVIKIKVNFTSPAEMIVYSAILIPIAVIGIGAFYYFKYNEKQYEKIANKIKNTKIVKKIKEELGEDEMDKVKVEQTKKGYKIEITGEKRK